MSVATGALWPERLNSSEILARTDVGMAGIAVALVAVALLPPAATLGMMLGSGQYTHAAGAGLLLAVNVVCINLSAKLMFWYQGVKPRTWLEKHRARQSFLISMLFWTVILCLLIAAIILRHQVSG